MQPSGKKRSDTLDLIPLLDQSFTEDWDSFMSFKVRFTCDANEEYFQHCGRRCIFMSERDSIKKCLHLILKRSGQGIRVE